MSKKQVQSISSFIKVFFKFFCEAPKDVKVKTEAEAESSFLELQMLNWVESQMQKENPVEMQFKIGINSWTTCEHYYLRHVVYLMYLFNPHLCMN